MQKTRLLLALSLLWILPQNIKAQQADSIGVVLMGGGALGFAHIGVLQYLEEINVPINRIAGTSMGGIVSGLYALGYSANELDTFARTRDWDNLLSNDFNWDLVPLHIIDTRYRYILSLRKSGGELGFDNAIINGMNIYNELQQFIYPISTNADFEKFTIPFFCVGVDLYSGEEIILDQGYLPDALTATMAIPAVFNPIEDRGHLLVDGSVLNNFPVKEMRERGADLVIGSKLVTSDSTTTYDGPIDILTRSYDIISQTARKDFEGDCDICIDIPLQGYTMADFDKSDSLIAIGYRAAKQNHDQLISLAKEGKLTRRAERVLPSRAQPKGTTLWQINILGNEYLESKDIKKIIKLQEGDSVSFADIKLALQRLQASDFINQLYYNFLFDEEGLILNLNVREKSNFSLNVGLRYDSDFGMSLLINPEVRNWGGFGNILQMEMRINENPYFKAAFLGLTNDFISPFASLKVSSDRYFDNTQINGEANEKQLNQVETRLGIHIQPTLKTVIGLGAEWQWYGFTEELTRTIFQNLNEDLINYYAEWETNALDKPYFPTKGFRFKGQYKLITDNLSSFNDDKAISWFAASYEQYLRLGKWMTFNFNGQLGFSNGIVDEQYLFYSGGQDRHLRPNLMVQPGQNLMTNRNQNIVAMQAAVRYNPSSSQHYALGYGISSLSQEFDQLTNQQFAQGVYFTAGYESFLGPLEIWLSTPIDSITIGVFIKAGFRF